MLPTFCQSEQTLGIKLKGTYLINYNAQESRVYVANMGPTWVLSAPDGHHISPTDLAIRGHYSNVITGLRRRNIYKPIQTRHDAIIYTTLCWQFSSLKPSDAYVSAKKPIVDSDNVLSPVRCQAIILTVDGVLTIKMQQFSFTRLDLQIPTAKWRT